jgi:DNA polymerase-3 subunit beta
MRIQLQKNDILPVLARIQGLTGRKTNLAITTSILIKTEENGITVSATDLETGFEGFYPATVKTPGIVAINARKLYEIVRDFPGDDIFLNKTDNHYIEIGNRKVEFNIMGLNPDDFPEIPRIEDVQFFEINAIVLAQMIEKSVIISGASDDNRAHITGVYTERFEQEKQKIFRLVSTDGSRLSKVDHLFDRQVSLPLGDGVLIPKKGLVEVAKFLDNEGSVNIGIKGSNFIVKKEKETLIIRLLEGDFPEYRDVIATGEGHDIALDRQLFLMMLKRMSILSSDEYKGVIFRFSPDKLTIHSTNPDIGESKEDMEIAYSGAPIEVMYNPRFFIDTLGVIHEDKVLINIINEERPCKITGENDSTYLSVIMPMRI